MSTAIAPTAAAPAAPPGGRADRFPPQIKYIIGNEVCERFTYYGILSILELYLVGRMECSKPDATKTVHLFGAAVYFLPLLGGWLADRWWGRYWTILRLSLFYCLGSAVLAPFEGNRLALFIGLTLIALGAGGIKPCVSTFVGDQFEADQQHLLTKVYGLFYWAINLGAAAGPFVIPWVHTHKNYGWAFGVPGFAMALATLFFWLGTRHYVRHPPAGAGSRLPFLGVIGCALRSRFRGLGILAKERGQDARATERGPGLLPNEDGRDAQAGFLDAARARYSREDIEGTRAVLGILRIFVTVPMFWALFNQVNSTWVLQASRMAPFHALNAETMQGVGAVLVMVWVPLLTLWAYPLAERLGLRPTRLRRMSAGMVLGAAAFLLCGLLQAWLDHGHSLSILWQLAPYVVLEAGEVMLSATALEFAFTQAPPPCKSIIMSFWLMTIAAGHFLIFAFTDLNQRFVRAKGPSEFCFYAVLMLAVAALFMVLAARYRERPPQRQ